MTLGLLNATDSGMSCWLRRITKTTLLAVLAKGTCSVLAESDAPFIFATEIKGDEVVINAHVPAGYQSAVLEISNDVSKGWQPIVTGEMVGEEGIVTFRFPDNEPAGFMRVRAGYTNELPPAPYNGAEHFTVDPGFYIFPEFEDSNVPPFGLNPVWSLNQAKKIGHLLNRIGYGPQLNDVTQIEKMGIGPYIESQLNTVKAPWQNNEKLQQKESTLFYDYQPTEDKIFVEEGENWRYFKGIKEPPRNWKTSSFNDSEWEVGQSGFGYGDNDDRTKLSDMRFYEETPNDPGQPGYLSLYIRRTFQMRNVEDIEKLILRVDYDDGFVAYLNGKEVTRANIEGFPKYNTKAKKGHEAGSPIDFDISDNLNLLKNGENLLALQIHNDKITSNDLTIIPELVKQSKLDIPTVKRIKDIKALQQLIHLRGIYSRRQLQAVLGEFWENHFTTDYDKLVEHLEELENSDGEEAMGEDQAEQEAAQMEYQEYEFFHQNALGNFGDLLLYSAASPSMLIYLDNVVNEKKEPNENYAREILELFGFGVDNRYDQLDIEELSKAFTGWNIRKAWPNDVKDFPQLAREPFTEVSAQYEEENKFNTGRTWRYFKGKQEPSGKKVGNDIIPTLDWTNINFNDSKWARGIVSIGYGDNDDKTIINDMRNKYMSLYLRHSFTISDPHEMENLMLHVEYDDGFVVYLNGKEIGRSDTMNFTGFPPPFDAEANAGHEATDKPMIINLKDHFGLLNLNEAKNILAIQVHNATKNSSDLTINPRLIERKTSAGSIENGDPNGVWTFRFNPDQHHLGVKTFFKETKYEHRVQSNQRGITGVQDAISVIDKMVEHPSTSEFICIKLVNRFVSDGITLETYHQRTAPHELLELMDDAITTWNSSKPAGNIAKVMRTILDPAKQQNAFWQDIGYREKIKTPIEFINSSIRALNAEVSGDDLPDYNSKLGMELFVRDDPDGYSEIGTDWMDTSTLLERMTFAQIIAENADNDVKWDAEALFAEKGPDTKIRYLVPKNASLGTKWTQVDFNDAKWSSVGTSVGYDNNSDFLDFIDLDLKAEMYQKQTSVYVRLPFLIEDPMQFEYLRLKMRYDDGFVAYLNGVKVASANAPTQLKWNSKATDGHPDSEGKELKVFSLSKHIKHLRKGRNVLAIHGMNNTQTSSDLLIQPQLRGGLGGGEAVVNYFDRLLFQNSLNQTQKNILLKFVNTNIAERPKTLDPASEDYTQKVQELVGLILSMPQWQFQ